jgi:diguanylate cyclase (GGDEF)-like protein
VRRLKKSGSLRTQVLGLWCSCTVLVAAAGFTLLLSRLSRHAELWATLGAGLLAAAGVLLWTMARLTGRLAAAWQGMRKRTARTAKQLRHAHEQHEESRQNLAQRTRTVDRLLEFSQTIQGAGRVEQIFPTLCHFLKSELGLSGVAVLAHESEPNPSVQVRMAAPDGFLSGSIAEFDTALCPCLRQSQPRVFRAGDSPVRCTIDQYLTLPPTHEAYCVPFNVGPRTQFVLHMLLPAGESWTEQRRQLAQTYANTAHSSLTSLNLLAEAERQSMTDALTGLFNRRSLDQLLQREVALAERHKQPLSIVMIDMDYFKQINDAHGHAAGDHLLRALADCIRITLRKTDLAFRYGGDEFVIALPQTPLAQAQQVVQKLRQAFAAVDFSSAITNLQPLPTLSIGVAERSAAMNLLTLPSMLAAVDQALYEAKNFSRNCVRTYQSPKADQPPKAA